MAGGRGLESGHQCRLRSIDGNQINGRFVCHHPLRLKPESHSGYYVAASIRSLRRTEATMGKAVDAYVGVGQ